MTAFNCTTQRQLADLFNISPEDFSSRKRRGTLTKLIEKESFRRNISYDWLKSGQGNMKTPGGQGFGTYIGETQTSYALNPPASSQTKDSDLLVKTAQILESNTVYRTALKSNIEAFHTAITCHEELAVANKRIDGLEENIKAIEKRLPAVAES